MHVLALSLGRSILEAGSRERARMRAYAKELDSYHIIVLTRHSHGFSTEVHEGNLHIYPTNSRSRFMMLVDAMRIARNIPLGTPSVVTAQDPFAIGFASFLIARKKRTRFHVQIHGDYFDSKYWNDGSLVKPLKLWLARTLMSRAAGIRVVSERIKRALVHAGVPESKITVLPIRPEVEKFLTCEHNTETGGVLNFLIMSRFSPEKNIPLMLRAFAQVHETHSNIHLRLCGRGSEEEKIKEIISRLGIKSSTEIVSWTEHPEEEYANADIFLLGSDHEAYGLTLIEALASGLPVVTTDVGCVGEVVQDGVHGIVVPPRDEHAYVQALERIITDTQFRVACGDAAKETACRLVSHTEQEYIDAWVASLS